MDIYAHAHVCFHTVQREVESYMIKHYMQFWIFKIKHKLNILQSHIYWALDSVIDAKTQNNDFCNSAKNRKSL